MDADLKRLYRLYNQKESPTAKEVLNFKPGGVSVKKAWYELSLKVHPDKHPSCNFEFTELQKWVTAAYEELK